MGTVARNRLIPVFSICRNILKNVAKEKSTGKTWVGNKYNIRLNRSDNS